MTTNRHRGNFVNYTTSRVENTDEAGFRNAAMWAGRILAVTAVVTLLGIYSVWMKSEIDRKFLEADEIKKMTNRLDEEIQMLEVEIEEMKSYERIERVLSEAGYNYRMPERSVHIDLGGEDGHVARGNRTAPGPY